MGAIIRFTQYEVFSPRTVRLMKFDTLRLAARLKHPTTPITPPVTRLHFGCGKRIVNGWVNADVVDADVLVDLAGGRLPWKDSVFESSVSQHVIEHLELASELLPLLHELRRIAKPNAELWLSCPDMEKVCRSYTEHKGEDLRREFIRLFPKSKDCPEPPQHVINSVFHQEGEHKNLFDFDLLRYACETSGFGECQQLTEADFLKQYPDFPPRDDDWHTIYVRAVAI
jgi:predicted SAM-dependent methyltransferase